MDCEKFDQHVIDALYDELDELTMAAMKRHMESCSRCASAFSALRATREVAVLPLEEPSEELESRILFAASAAQRKTPWHKKALRALAWAGSHAMRPQLAMAAVFVLVIGSSLLLLRAKPGTTAIGPVRVTERGEPSPERDDSAQQAAATASPAAPSAAPVDPQAAPPPAAVAEIAPPRSAADGADEANDKQKDAKATKGGSSEAQTALADARSTEGSLGCDAALPKYEDVGVRFSGTPQAAEAMWAAASCHKKRGDTNRARELYGVLAKRDDYKEKAAQALNEIAPVTNAQAVAGAGAPAASASATGAPASSVAANQAPAYGGRAGAVAGPMPAPAPPRMAPAGGAKNAAPAKSPVYTDADAKSAPAGGATRNAAPERQKAADSAL
jgi:hypothetical protein